VSESRVTGPQLKRLQTLYGQLCAHTQERNTREARLRWASDLVGRSIASFSDLTQSDARHLIDATQGQLGVQHPVKHRMPREAADRHGRDGRRDGDDLAAVPEMVSADDLATIEEYYSRLGWTRDRFDAWLRSPHSPLKKTAPTIRTKADANRVRWALIGMLKSAGLWSDNKRRQACA
jgi:hypothetical protein